MRRLRGALLPDCLTLPGTEDSKSHLEAGGLGAQTLVWDV